jgi:hypothetical protein
MTAGEWAKQTRVERGLGAFALLTFGMCGLSGVLCAVAVIPLGQLTGNLVTDSVVLSFVLMASLFTLRQGLFLTEGPVCRSCRTPLKDTQFRCGECAALVDDRITS